ncbi:MAG: acyltransferase, partial [Chitinophagaceae bacterium]
MTSLPTTDTGAQAIPGRKFTFELVQIFRGFAAMLVVGYHCHGAMISYFGAVPLKGVFAIGLFGVDFFFVLSGFIITYIHVTDIRQQRNIVPFFKKRFFRIYPIYWVVALASFAYLVFVDHGKLEFADHTLAWSNGTDWLYVLKSFLLFPQPAISILDVSWTLSFEMLFYLVFGLAIIGGWKIARILFFTWLTLILLNAFGLLPVNSYYPGFLLSPLILEFLMGCLL